MEGAQAGVMAINRAQAVCQARCTQVRRTHVASSFCPSSNPRDCCYISLRKEQRASERVGRFPQATQLRNASWDAETHCHGKAKGRRENPQDLECRSGSEGQGEQGTRFKGDTLCPRSLMGQVYARRTRAKDQSPPSGSSAALGAELQGRVRSY